MEGQAQRDLQGRGVRGRGALQPRKICDRAEARGDREPSAGAECKDQKPRRAEHAATSAAARTSAGAAGTAAEQSPKDTGLRQMRGLLQQHQAAETRIVGAPPAASPQRPVVPAPTHKPKRVASQYGSSESIPRANEAGEAGASESAASQEDDEQGDGKAVVPEQDHTEAGTARESGCDRAKGAADTAGYAESSDEIRNSPILPKSAGPPCETVSQAREGQRDNEGRLMKGPRPLRPRERLAGFNELRIREVKQSTQSLAH